MESVSTHSRRVRLRPRHFLTPLVAVVSIMGGLHAVTAQAQHISPRGAPAAHATAYATVGSVRLPSGDAYSLAISNDDTVYAATSGSNYVAIINPRRSSGSIDDSFAATFPSSVAVSSDDTIFVMEYSDQRVSSFLPDKTRDDSVVLGNYYFDLSYGGDDTIAATTGSTTSATFIRGRDLGGATSVSTAGTPEMGAFDSQRRFVAGLNTVGLATFAADGQSVLSTIAAGDRLITTIINSDDTRYVAVRAAVGEVRVVAPGALSFAYSVPVNALPQDLAFTPAGDIIVTSNGRRTLQLIGRNSSTSDTIITGLVDPTSLVIASTGLVYVAQTGVSEIAVAAPVSAALASSTGSAGSSVSISITGLPVGSLMDDSAVTGVWWGDDTVAYARTPGANAVSVTAPPGNGSVPVVLQLRGGNAVTAGTFTYPATPPPPTPLTPALAPRDVTAAAADAAASVSWTAPSTSGSYPVSHYLVTSAPESRTCLVAAPTTSCDVTGLSNGTAYTFTVKALTGAGWSAASEPSNAVIPRAAARPSIMITGSRVGERIQIAGKATGFGMGGTLRPWLRLAGQSAYSEGAATILVNMDGTFEWGRRTGKRVSVYVATPDDSVRSNAVTVR